MSRSDHGRKPQRVIQRTQEAPRYQPRPPRRKTGTRHGVIRAALKEG
jgi:hypothetical protein